MDLGLTHDTEVSITVQGDSFIAYFFAGPTSGDVIRQYTELTGHMPLPPRWTLGYHQSRWGYTSEQQVRQIANRLRERNHPCDAIWLDIDYMHEYHNFTWNADQFPDPAQMIHDIHNQGTPQYGSNKTNQVTRAIIWWKSRSSSKGGASQCSGFLRA